jgi:hypothetical protein
MSRAREQFKRRNTETKVERISGLQVVEFDFNWSKSSKTTLRRKRIVDRILHGENLCTVEQVARQTRTNCKLVRAVVDDLKRNGLILESTFPKHVLLRIKT